MYNIITFFYNLKTIMVHKNKHAVSAFINKGITDQFEPSQKTISNLMAYSSAVYSKKTDSIGQFESLMN